VGYNVLNPALTARAYLFFAHPAQISGEAVWTRLAPGVDLPEVVDGVTGATALAVASATESQPAVQALTEAGYSWWRMAAGNIPGSFGETSFILCMLGAVVLLVTRVGSARIMISAWIGLAVGVTLMNLMPSADPMSRLPFHYHAVMGGFAFGVTFMATDPVSAAASPLGKILYGLSIGLLVGWIRVFGSFPEVTMLAILFMNVMAPMIDHYVVQAHIRRRLRRA
jgi:Na+-transporting NADH:ubiquinone oxidoreductase subunit B